ncbi:MAG: hypothetical protein ACTMIR_08270 [Cellulomonadaceae bacterium]
MNARLLLRTSLRLARPRQGVAWATPVVVVVAVVVLLHASLVRIVMPVAGQQMLEHGGHEATLELGSLGSIDPAADTAAALDEGRAADPEACVSLSAILVPDADTNSVAVLTELEGCNAVSFGWTLAAGTWPQRPGEIAVSTATGWEAGHVLPAGLLPAESTIVAVTENRWAERGRTILAAPGTWASFGWPEVAERFPRLGATMALHTTVETQTVWLWRMPSRRATVRWLS